MTKKVEKKVEEVVEVKNEQVEQPQVVETQPAPQTMNYDQALIVSDKFVDDVIACLGDFAYVETHEIIDFVRYNKGKAVPINLLNEFINKLATFPWRAVNVIMYNINNKQEEYFTLESK